MTQTDDSQRTASTLAAVANPGRSGTSAAPGRGAGHSDDAGADPLASLHKMSTTAGISSQEYVAINIPSVIALLLGLASVFAVLHPVLLLIPLTAVVTALVSLSQIRHSNGTQTGRIFAYLGILIALAIGGFVLVREVIQRLQTRADRAAIIARIEEMGRLVNAGDYEKAYALFTPAFQERIKFDVFKARWEETQGFPTYGRIKSMEWNETAIFFQQDPATRVKRGTAAARMRFEKTSEPARQPFEFRYTDGAWMFEDAPQLFPSERRQRVRPPQ